MEQGTITVKTSRKREFADLTAELARAVAAAGVGDGVLHVYNPHTTAGLTINEGADPAVARDILAALDHLVPDIGFQHLEGNSPAHIMASLVGSSVTVFVEGGRLRLGTWQKVFFCEFDGPRSRQVWYRLLPAG